MATTCETCGASQALTTLTELGFGQAHDGQSIQLCQGCLERRQAAAWPAGDPNALGIMEALGQRKAPPRDRYTYLQDQEDALHLLRLRPAWVDRHAVDA